MSFLVDTNILVRVINTRDALHQVAIRAVDHLAGHRETLSITPQVLTEFWVVATRPLQVNGLGLPSAQALGFINQCKQTFTLLPDTHTIFDRWLTVVTEREVLGKQAHDARIVACMLVHGITDLLTFNDVDFKRFSGMIRVRTPQSIFADQTAT